MVDHSFDIFSNNNNVTLSIVNKTIPIKIRTFAVLIGYIALGYNLTIGHLSHGKVGIDVAIHSSEKIKQMLNSSGS